MCVTVVQGLRVSSCEYSYSEEEEEEEEEEEVEEGDDDDDDDDKNNDDDKFGNIFCSWASTGSQEGLRRPRKLKSTTVKEHYNK